jgi:hypothetical protein
VPASRPPEPLPEPELPPEPLPPELLPEDVVPELPPVPMASVSEPLSETPCCDPVVEPHAAANNQGTRYRARPNRDKATSIMAGERSTPRTEVQLVETIVGMFERCRAGVCQLGPPGRGASPAIESDRPRRSVLALVCRKKGPRGPKMHA